MGCDHSGRTQLGRSDAAVAVYVCRCRGRRPSADHRWGSRPWRNGRLARGSNHGVVQPSDRPSSGASDRFGLADPDGLFGRVGVGVRGGFCLTNRCSCRRRLRRCWSNGHSGRAALRRVWGRDRGYGHRHRPRDSHGCQDVPSRTTRPPLPGRMHPAPRRRPHRSWRALDRVERLRGPATRSGLCRGDW